MSSILKALKRVEEEISGTGEGPVTTKKDESSKKAIPEPIERLLIFGGKVMILCMGGCALFWLFTYFNMDVSPWPETTPLPALPIRMPIPSPPSAVETDDLLRKDMSSLPDIVGPPLKKPREEIVLETKKSFSPPPATGAKKQVAAPSPASTDDEKIADANWLSLQALSWEHDPKRRIAVINGKIVKEGSAVDRGTVTLIRPDAVVIRSQGKSWRLRFQHR